MKHLMEMAAEGARTLPYGAAAATRSLPAHPDSGTPRTRAEATHASPLLAVLIACNLSLAALHVLFTHLIVAFPTLTAWFNLDAEINVPTWFSSTQLFVCFLLFRANAGRLAGISPQLAKSYTLLAFGFLYFSMDEASAIHERLGSLVREIWSPAPSMPWGNSILAYGLVALAFLVRFRAPARAFLSAHGLGSRLSAGILTWIAGAVAVELIGLQLKRHGYDRTIFLNVEVVLEECLEMLGESLIIAALLRRLEANPLSNAGERTDHP